MKNFLVAAMLLAVAATGLQGCTEQEENIAAGAIIGGIIGGVIADDHDHHHGGHGAVCHGGYVTQCSEHHDYYGNWIRECHQVWDSCARYYDVRTMTGSNINEKTADLISTFKVSKEAAFKIEDSVALLSEGDSSGLKAIGLSRKDLQAITEHRSLTAKSIDNVAKSLNVSVDTAKNMMNKISAKYAEMYPQNSFPGGAQGN